MALKDAIWLVMMARGLSKAEVARQLRVTHRTNFYRILSGQTQQPYLGTLRAICTTLDVSPTDLLELADLWSTGSHAVDPMDVRLRAVFARLRALPRENKPPAITLVMAVAHGLQQNKANANG
jgi:DNA-binding Xre family transcriptional regulator